MLRPILLATLMMLGMPGLFYSQAAQAATIPTSAALATKLEHTVTPALIQQLQRASMAGLQLSTRPAVVHLQEIQGPALGKKPVLLYIGADFCPYCAAQRWGLTLTLLRFGKLSGVKYMLSSAHDVYANTPTFTFQFARFVSPYLRFQAIETASRNKRPLMKMTPQAIKIFKIFDAPPYTHFSYGIPFVYLNGAYLLNVPMISPAQLQGLSWHEITNEMGNPQSNLINCPAASYLAALDFATRSGVLHYQFKRLRV